MPVYSKQNPQPLSCDGSASEKTAKMASKVQDSASTSKNGAIRTGKKHRKRKNQKKNSSVSSEDAAASLLANDSREKLALKKPAVQFDLEKIDVRYYQRKDIIYSPASHAKLQEHTASSPDINTENSKTSPRSILKIPDSWKSREFICNQTLHKDAFAKRRIQKHSFTIEEPDFGTVTKSNSAPEEPQHGQENEGNLREERLPADSNTLSVPIQQMGSMSIDDDQDGHNSELDQEAVISLPIRPVNHVKHIWEDKNDRVKLVISPHEKIQLETRVNFSANFLEIHLAESSQILHWKIHLAHPIRPNCSSFRIDHGENYVQILLMKETPLKWTSLENLCPPQSLSQVESGSCSTLNHPSNLDGVDAEPDVGSDAGVQKTSPMVGLLNNGNFCFLNTILQCLYHCEPLRNYYIKDHYLGEIRKENRDGTHGELSMAFSSVLKKMFQSCTGSLHSLSPSQLPILDPMELHHSLGKWSHFSNGHQHDAQEFLAFLLDKLHEDVNLVTKKPYIVRPDCIYTGDINRLQNIKEKYLNDLKMAQTEWNNHLLRDNSFFTKNFQGQYRSSTICQHCQSESVTFEPFTFLSLPIPDSKTQAPFSLVVRVFSILDPLDCVKITFANVKTSNTLADLKQWITNALYDSPQSRFASSPQTNKNIVLYTSKNHFISHWFPPTPGASRPLDFITPHINVYASIALTETCRNTASSYPFIHRIEGCQASSTCHHCGTQSSVDLTLKKCLRCKSVVYCSKSCQQKDWKTHRSNCTEAKFHPAFYPQIIPLPQTQQIQIGTLYQSVFNFIKHFLNTTLEAKTKIDLDSTAILEYFVLRKCDFQGKTLTSPLDQIKSGSDLKQSFHDMVDLEPLGCFSIDWNHKKVFQVLDTALLETLHERDVDDSLIELPQDRASSQNSTDLYNCLDSFTREEIIEGSNGWVCPTCKISRPAAKKIQLWKIPSLLIIQLKRFKFDGNGHPGLLLHMMKQKINTVVNIDSDCLDLSKYVLFQGKAPLESNKYQLYAMARHIGVSFVGHYTAVAKPLANQQNNSMSQWRLFDDESVEKIDIESFHKGGHAPYLLFYQRIVT